MISIHHSIFFAWRLSIDSYKHNEQQVTSYDPVVLRGYNFNHDDFPFEVHSSAPFVLSGKNIRFYVLSNISLRWFIRLWNMKKRKIFNDKRQLQGSQNRRWLKLKSLPSLCTVQSSFKKSYITDLLKSWRMFGAMKLRKMCRNFAQLGLWRNWTRVGLAGLKWRLGLGTGYIFN